MLFVIYVAPYFSENARGFIQAVANLPDIRFGLISQEPQEHLPEAVQAKIAAHWRLDDALDTTQLLHAARQFEQHIGKIDRLFGAVEQIQVQLAEVRAQLGIPGMGVEATTNFRDKAQMKQVLRAAGVPCARYRQVNSPQDAWAFAAEIGYPLVIKPLAGAASQTTYRVEDAASMQQALHNVKPSLQQPAIIEEFITGHEHSFETISIEGQAVWHSLTRYYPAPLDAMRNPWIQFCLVLPREIDDPMYDDIRQVGRQALEALGMGTGMTHMEWFRRPDGSIAISEVAARPPGGQIPALISRANDIDFLTAWARLMVFGTFEVPERKYAVAVAFLRGQGRGRVKAIHGLDQADREVGHLVTDVRLPQIGQEAAASYEGEGFIILRHPETAVVEQAVKRLVSLVRVELG